MLHGDPRQPRLHLPPVVVLTVLADLPVADLGWILRFLLQLHRGESAIHPVHPRETHIQGEL